MNRDRDNIKFFLFFRIYRIVVGQRTEWYKVSARWVCFLFGWRIVYIFFFIFVGIEIKRTSQAFLVKDFFGFYYSSFLNSTELN